MPALKAAAIDAGPTISLGACPRFVIPTLCDCFFLAILVWLFLAGEHGWKALLADGDTGWHIRTGQYILSHARIPTQDLFSFSRPEAPWFAWEWLSDVLFGILYGWAGLKAVVLFSGAIIAVFSTLILRFALWRGANVMLALPFTMLAVGSSSMHFLARPHLFTLLFLPLGLWALESDRRNPSRALWLWVPLTALWTNLHGGFAAFLVCLALMIVALTIESLLGHVQWTAIRRYSTLLAGCTAATLVNPYGYQLHVHIFQFLRSDWIRAMVQEFQAPTFRSEGQSQLEILLLAGLIVAGLLLVRGKYVEAIWIVFLAHSTLGSIRHAPLYAAIAVPIIAAELTAIWQTGLVTAKRTALRRILFELGRDLAFTFRRVSIWAPVAIAVIACINAPIAWPVDFPSEIFPVVMVHRNATRLMHNRVFTTDQWADYLIYSFYPQGKVFFDGRSDFYGEALGQDYLSLLQGSYSSLQLLDRFQFGLVLVPAQWPLSAILKNTTGWQVLEDDGRAILFARRTPSGIAAGPGGSDPRNASKLMKRGDSAEVINRRAKGV